MQISRLLTTLLLLSISFRESAVRAEWKDTPWKPLCWTTVWASHSDKAVQGYGWGPPKPTIILGGLVSTTMHVICSFLTTIQQSMHSLAFICHLFSPQNHSWLLTATEKFSQKNTVSMCCWLTTTTTTTGSTYPFAFCLDELPAWGHQNWLCFHHPGDECYKEGAQLHWFTRPMKRLPKVHSFKLRLFLSWWSLPEVFTLNHIPVATQWRQFKSIKAQQ